MSLKPTPDREIKIDERTGIYYYRGTPIKGARELTKSLAVRNFRTAVQAKREYLMSIRGVDPTAKDILFRDYVKHVFLPERKRKSPATYETAFFSVKSLLPFFETYTMRQVTERAWDEYKEYMGQIKPTRLLKYDRLHLLMMLHRLHKKGVVKEIPELHLLERPIKRRRVLTEKEIDLLYDHTETSRTLRGLILFMHKMGCRPGEALGATWDEFEIEKGIWNIPAHRTKTRTARSIKLNLSVKLWLQERIAESKSKYVFPSRLNPTMHIDRYNKQWDRMLKAAKLNPEITPYYLRHTFLTECAKRVRDGKISLVQITTYAGTSISEFERTYLHIEGEDTKDVATIMEGV